MCLDMLQARQEVTLAAIAKDHLRRMLDHQEKIKAEQPVADQQIDRQLKMPLIGEVRKTESASPKRGRPRKKTFTQPRLGD
jgi:hypothetical protein